MSNSKPNSKPNSNQQRKSNYSSTESRSKLGPKRARIVSSLRYLFGKSGGLSYHTTALRFRRLWAPFLQHVNDWLNSWPTPQSDLIIFGASAGWTLPSHFLARFERVIVVEPDPAARFLLRRRFPKVQNWICHDQTDLLPWFVSTHSNQLKKFLDKYPDAAVLFSNLLGQIPLIWPRELSPEEWGHCNLVFIDALERRNWASYHDLLSASCKMPMRDFEKIEWLEGENLEQLGARLWSGSQKQIVVADHGMSWLKSRELALWHLRPKTYHLIGFATSQDLHRPHNKPAIEGEHHQ